MGKYPKTLKGRAVGILVADGSDSAVIDQVKAAVIAAGAKPKVVAPKLNVKLDGGDPQPVDGQLAGTPSVVLDAVALVLSKAGTQSLLKEGAAVDFSQGRLQPPQGDRLHGRLAAAARQGGS